ncbi:MAG: class I SAM-dependent methyltransferase [Desulfarculales bacterium]|jgi:SAM-dependent methyltransferase|nr:class I SAM-dependent methyltransferase [Desulfarculales bacterium]
METVTCPFCRSDDCEILFHARDTAYCLDEIFFPVARCRVCRACYLRRRPTMENMGYYYPTQFYDLNKNQITSSNLAARFAWIEDLAPGRLLDLGCAGAEFVNYAAERAWQAWGYDWFAEDKNPQPKVIYKTPLPEAFSPNSFDAITMWAVLEHLYDPLAVLRQIHKLLKPGGRLVALVPNFASIPARLMRSEDIPRHTNFFTRATLTEFFRQSGFIPRLWHFDGKIFKTSHRGCLVYLYKLLRGETMEHIVAQYRNRRDRYSFYNTVHNRPSVIVKYLSRLDGKLTPYLDGLADFLHAGAIMTVSARAQ